VTKEAISSFEIEDEDYPHPRVGVCRRCWRQFFQRDSFEEHTSNACEKVSKGKREKWQVLYESFTPLVDPSTKPDNLDRELQGAEQAEPREELPRSPSRQSGFFAAGVEAAAWDEPMSPTSAPPATPFFAQPAASANATHESATVPMEDYELLQRERDELRQKNLQLERMHHALLVSRTYQNASAFGSVAHGPRPDPLAIMAASSSNLPIAGPSRTRPSARPSAPSDRESLVQHMGSQPPEVDIDGLMNEPHENLSRQNSDLSSRSTIHHVTNSPPLPTDEYEPDGDGKDGNFQAKAVKPPTSDSGYVSLGHPRHGSFGDMSAMPGIAELHHNRGHHRNSSSMSTLTYHGDNPSGVSWKPNTAMSGQHQQHPNTFMAQPQPQAQPQQQAGETPLDDASFQQFLNMDMENIDHFFASSGSGVYDNRN